MTISLLPRILTPEEQLVSGSYGDFQQRLQQVRAAKGNALEILQRLEQQSAEELSELLPALFSSGYAGEEQQALRDTALAVLQRKLTSAQVDALTKLNLSIAALDQSTARLTRIGWWLTIVVGAVGIVASILVSIALAN